MHLRLLAQHAPPLQINAKAHSWQKTRLQAQHIRPVLNHLGRAEGMARKARMSPRGDDGDNPEKRFAFLGWSRRDQGRSGPPYIACAALYARLH